MISYTFQNMYSFFIEDSLTLSKRVAQLDGDIETLRAKVKKLEEDMTTLQEQNVMGAFNLIKKNVQEAKEYQTKVLAYGYDCAFPSLERGKMTHHPLKCSVWLWP